MVKGKGSKRARKKPAKRTRKGTKWANSRNTPNSVRAAVRAVEAINLRQAGLNFRQIGEQLGVTKQAAHQMIVRELEERLDETVGQFRKLQNGRYGRVLAYLNAIIFNQKPNGVYVHGFDERDKALGKMLGVLGKMDAINGLVSAQLKLTGGDGGPIKAETNVKIKDEKVILNVVQVLNESGALKDLMLKHGRPGDVVGDNGLPKG